MGKKILKCFLGFLIFLLLFVGYFFIGTPPQAKNGYPLQRVWGVNFSQGHAELLGLDWKELYLSLLDDLEVRRLKLAAYWDRIEGREGKYHFEDLDWQIKEAQDRGGKILLVLGRKLPRWPECHIPGWAINLKEAEQQEKILKLIEKIVLRYRDFDAIWAWQVENEPFFPFGECPGPDKNFLKKEIDLVKSLDYKERPIVISDSGEFSFWITAARLGDIVGTTMYKKVWFKELSIYVHYPFKPIFYWKKAQIIKKLFGKEVICVELQAEPWGPTLLYGLPLQEQEKTMNLTQFRKNIEFAKKTGLDEFYLWGAEWWYWLKKKENRPEIWEEAKKLFINHEK